VGLTPELQRKVRTVFCYLRRVRQLFPSSAQCDTKPTSARRQTAEVVVIIADYIYASYYCEILGQLADIDSSEVSYLW